MLACVILAIAIQTPGAMTLTPSMEPIRTSTKVIPGTYTLTDNDGKGAVKIDADNIVVDFQGATIQAPALSTGRQETFNGLGVAVNGHKNVTIRRARIHGFQFNFKALQCSGLRLEECEISQSRSQKILEDGHVNTIWLDLRSLDSWRGYGAGAWIEKCSGCTLKGLRANQSQNGLVMVGCSHCTVVGCDFSYNSGWGIALCRSTDNLLCWNHADFVNRPWAGGWGGDSSGVALTTSSHRNIWAFNSFTHSGDGLFLTALNGGFDSTGKLQRRGPCDGNWVVYNDGSWSTANAFESTFSEKNTFYKNVCSDSNYGFWLGYSSNNLILGNEIKRSHLDGIATEQGSKNDYIENEIGDTGATAIHLWSGTDAKFKQSPSADNRLLGNRIYRAKVGIQLTNSEPYVAQGNVVRDAALSADFHETAPAPSQSITADVARLAEIMKMKPLGFKMYRDTDLPKGWQWLTASTYGMRDYRKMIVPWNMKDSRTLRLYMPPGRKVRADLPDWLEMAKGSGPNEWFVSPKPTGEPYGEYRNVSFNVTDSTGAADRITTSLLDLRWHIRWFKWFRNDHDAFSDVEAWKALFAGPALKEEDLPDLPEIPGYKAPEPGLPVDHFALVGTTKIKLAAGTYRFDSISDDGIQVVVDGQKVIDNWTHHGGTSDTGRIKLQAGVHSIEVRYCQEDGGAALSLVWSRSGN